MTRLQSDFAKVCGELGLRLEIPFNLKLPDGCEVTAQVLLPQLGAPRGMIIVTSFSELKGKKTELVNMGFGYSVLDEPRIDEEYNLDSYVEMFSEWGWSSDEAKPE